MVYLNHNEEPSEDNSNLPENDLPRQTSPTHTTERSVWMGTCVHNFETPRWVQKRRRVEPHDQDDTSYFEPNRAVEIAMNAKFSLIAVGMFGYAFSHCLLFYLFISILRGGIQYTTFPGDEGVLPTSQKVEIPNPFNRQTGPVCSMEWSSDGYVLAVGWKHGWGIFSVGGRCLVSAFGVEDVVDEQKYILSLRCENILTDRRFQDAFMYGISNLVSTVLYYSFSRLKQLLVLGAWKL